MKAGLLAGTLAGLVMTLVMLALGCFGVATPLFIFGDRLSVFIPAGPFLKLMGFVGGYNHMKQLGVGSVIGGQIVLGAIGGMIYGNLRQLRRPFATVAVFVALPFVALGGALWPVIGTNYRGFSMAAGTAITLFGLLVSF